MGDEDETLVSQGIFVNAWMPLPESYETPEEPQLCTNGECSYNANGDSKCPAWNGCGGFEKKG